MVFVYGIWDLYGILWPILWDLKSDFVEFHGILWEFIVVTSGLNYKINSWETVLVFRSE